MTAGRSTPARHTSAHRQRACIVTAPGQAWRRSPLVATSRSAGRIRQSGRPMWYVRPPHPPGRSAPPGNIPPAHAGLKLLLFQRRRPPAPARPAAAPDNATRKLGPGPAGPAVSVHRSATQRRLAALVSGLSTAAGVEKRAERESGRSPRHGAGKRDAADKTATRQSTGRARSDRIQPHPPPRRAAPPPGCD